MRTHFGSASNRSTMEIMMTPMIDVVFLLLIFFLTTASFEIVEQLLPSGISDQGMAANGPAVDSPPPETITDINDCIVKIRGGRDEPFRYQYELNGAPLSSPEEVAERLRAIIAVRADTPIIIDPEDHVRIETAVAIYDRARAAGGLRIYFAAR